MPRRPAPLLLSGLLLGLAVPPFHLVLPSFVALVPFGVWVADLPAGDVEGRAEALRGGFLLGLVSYTLVFYWLLTSLIYYTPMAILAFALPVLIMSGFLAVATEGMRQARVRLAWPLWIALPVFWTAVEWLRGHLGPVSFPWMQLGDSLAATPRLAGAADLVGSRGLSFWLALVSGLGAGLWVAWRSRGSAGAGRPGAAGSGAADSGPGGGAVSGEGGRGRRLRWLAGGLTAALALPIAYSVVRYETIDLRPAARVAVIQPNVEEDLKMKEEAAVDTAMTSFYRLTSDSVLPDTAGLDMIVLPETAFPAYVESIPSTGWAGRPDILGMIRRVARATDARILFGAIGSHDLGNGDWNYFNTAYLMDTGGRLVGRYDKHYLVPMVERVPFVPPSWLDRFPFFGGFARGEKAPIFRSDGGSFGIVICYEDVFADWPRRYRNEGADFLVNITNDAWFGREMPWWSRTSALWQHPAHLAMRAIENRMGAVRSANTGISEIIDPLGRVSHETALFRPAAFTATVMTSDVRTLYDRWGDVVGWGSILAAVGAALASLLRGRREGGAGGRGAEEAGRRPAT